MITKMFSIFDSKAAVYGTPFFMANSAMAIRAFTDLVNDPNSMCAKHPEDFSLFYIGEFDDAVAGVVTSNPLNLVTASSLKRVPEVIDLAKLRGSGKVNGGGVEVVSEVK